MSPKELAESSTCEAIASQWQIMPTLIPEAKSGGRRRTVEMIEVVNGIFYILVAGCAWSLLPHDFAKWKTVYHYFRQWRIDGNWERIHEQLILLSLEFILIVAESLKLKYSIAHVSPLAIIGKQRLGVKSV